MSEVSVTFTFDGRRTIRYVGTIARDGGLADCGRWARQVYRDWWVNPARHHRGDDATRTVVPVREPVFLRDPSFLVELSDGTVFGGEFAPDFAQRRCVEWVRDGKR